MPSVIVYTLLLVVFTGEDSISTARQYATMQACDDAAAAAHDAAKVSMNMVDIGTLCVVSKFNPLIRPKA